MVNNKHFITYKVENLKKILNNVSLLFGYGYNCNSYLITSSNGESLLIDSGLGSFDATWGYTLNNPLQELLTVIKSYNITNVFLTHAHLDHVGGIASLTSGQREKVEIYCHEVEKKYLELPDSHYIDPLMRSSLESISISKSFANKENFGFGDLNFEVIHTPGHTQGSICLYEPTKKWLFSGDCVFPQGSFGRVDFPGSDAEKMLSSLEILTSLEIESLFAGHMEPLITDAQESIKMSFRNAKLMIG